jgi:chemotaxis protein methyltransferase CheR
MPPEELAEAIDPGNYRFLQQHVYSHAGLVLDGDKHYLLESRLAPIVQRLGLESINALCFLIRSPRQRDLGRQVAEAITTSETYFFRDPAQYSAIRDILLPRLTHERRHTRHLRFWSAASSTGQEAYSLAMLLIEAGLSGWNIEILGSDFSACVIERARAARYQQIEVNRGLPSPLLVKYFRREGTDWILSEEVRKMVNFEIFDLRTQVPKSPPFDLVFCRNVMIYFDLPTRLKILRQLRDTLLPGGWLLLGGAETISGIDEHFDRVPLPDATAYAAR